ncbi:hypothetical protein NUKP74_51130 [Klebsiella quasipneumoniae]|uniref:DUF6904 family protein n=1 Tax=Klebsiella quasipneumoniae TaxID=1463165 RepID=UPI002181A9AD|nr:hypothetical protein [Klebsiella quasipneumoniae]GKQ01411.1 hypothetical protein NUKP74_51130 [Klebsiella quasipneumoniae]
MLRYELTPNNAGFILWGDSEALNELHELIHYIVDESPLIKVKDGFMLSLAYDIRKAREGNRLLWPLVLVQSSILRNSMGYIQTDKNQLSVMYAFEYLIESALTESERTTSNDIMLTVKYASDSDFNFIEDNIDSRCCYFISLSPEQRKKQLISIVRSFHSLWGKYAREKQDIKMLNEMNNTSWVWPDNINW